MVVNKKLVGLLKEHCEALALEKGRRVGQPGHDVAREYLLGEMERLELQPFEGGGFELCYERTHPKTRELQLFSNLVGVIPGKDRELPPILVGAHYDSVIDAPCVDDNATSVAMTLELARYFKSKVLDRDLIVAFFDAEEPPHFLGETMGSRRFCEDYCQEMKFAAVIVSDLIGHEATDGSLPIPSYIKYLFPHLRKLLAVIGAESDRLFPDILEDTAASAKGVRVLATLHRNVGPMSDHGPFAEAGHPFLFLSCGQGRHYHTPEDRMDWINFKKLAYTTHFTAELMERIDRAAVGEPCPCDPYEMEARLLKKSLGLGVCFLLKRLGVQIPKSRQELDSFMTAIVDGHVR